MVKQKYRSKFEENVANKLPNTWLYEPERFEYMQPRKYVPDFVEGEVWLEVKGFFRAGDVSKYKSIRKAYPNKRLIFVFSNPLKKVRKGAKMCMGQWADKNGWEYTTLDKLEEYLDGTNTI